jgi:hypothetical protein
MRQAFNRFVRLFPFRACCVLVGCLWWTSCVYVSTVVEREDMSKRERQPEQSDGKLYKVHLVDGSMVLFKEGLEVREGALVGRGTKYDLTRTESGSVWMVPRDSVMLVLSYQEEAQTLQSVSMNLAFVLAFSALFIALLAPVLSKMHG